MTYMGETKIYFLSNQHFFLPSADHLAGASVCVKSIIRDGENLSSSEGKWEAEKYRFESSSTSCDSNTVE
jgi:hypothetical protein